MGDPLQAFSDLLRYRFIKSSDAGFDIGTEQAFDGWVADGRPGFPLP